MLQSAIVSSGLKVPVTFGAGNGAPTQGLVSGRPDLDLLPYTAYIERDTPTIVCIFIGTNDVPNSKGPLVVKVRHLILVWYTWACTRVCIACAATAA